jgi:hypothetical protein
VKVLTPLNGVLKRVPAHRSSPVLVPYSRFSVILAVDIKEESDSSDFETVDASDWVIQDQTPPEQIPVFVRSSSVQGFIFPLVFPLFK